MTAVSAAAFSRNLKIAHAVFMDFLLVPYIHHSSDGLAQDIDRLDLTDQAIRAFHLIAHAGQVLVELFIRLLFVLEAAHQSPAYAGDLGRVERKILLLGHLDGDRGEIIEE